MATDEAYEAAALAYDEAVNAILLNPPGSVFGEHGRKLWAEHPAFRAAVDAVWDLAVAEGRRQAAEAIRAANVPLRWCDDEDDAGEWAARIAAGSTPTEAALVYGDPCPVCGKDGWPPGSAGNARRGHELREHEGDPRIEPRWRQP